MRHLATIQVVKNIQPIQGADKIVTAQIKDWNVVTQKDNFKIGDKCVYFEIDSFLPINKTFEFLTKSSTPKTLNIDGVDKTGIRLKTIRLKGQVSQGLILPLSEFEGFDNLEVGADVTEALGVYKYEPPVPAYLSGLVKGSFPSFIPKTDEERIQNMGEVLYQYYVTEKLDGTSVTFYKSDGVFGVCSRNLELKDSGQTQWKIAKDLNIELKLPDNIAIQGEIIGEGIQGNKYHIKGHKVFFYQVYNIKSARYLNYLDMREFLNARELPMVPVLDDNFMLPNNVEDMLGYADGKSMLYDTLREGVVVRPKIETLYKGVRLSFKAISNEFLLKDK